MTCLTEPTQAPTDTCRTCKGQRVANCDGAGIIEREVWSPPLRWPDYERLGCPSFIARKRRHGGAYPADWLLSEFPAPTLYADADLAEPCAGAWEFQEPARLAILAAVTDLRGVYLHGQANRAGKTRLAFSAVRYAREVLCIPALHINAPDLMRVITASFQPGFDRFCEDDLLDALGRETRLLVLDDLGQGKVSEYADGVFYSLANMRRNADLPTIVTSNFSRSELIQKFGPATISRLLENAADVHLEPPRSKWVSLPGNPTNNTERDMTNA